MSSKGKGKSQPPKGDTHVIPPLEPKWSVPPKTPCQKVLFSGMDCAAGQLDLFPTDGEESGELRENLG